MQPSYMYEKTIHWRHNGCEDETVRWNNCQSHIAWMCYMCSAILPARHVPAVWSHHGRGRFPSKRIRNNRQVCQIDVWNAPSLSPSENRLQFKHGICRLMFIRLRYDEKADEGHVHIAATFNLSNLLCFWDIMYAFELVRGFTKPFK